MQMQKTLVVPLVVLHLAIAAPSFAQVINAASCNQSDVQNAVNSAGTGNTVQIPAGTCHWTGQVVWNIPSNAILLGAGNLTVVGGGDVTIIIDDSVSGDPNTIQPPILVLNTPSTGTFRMAGITFRGGTGTIKDNGLIGIFGTNAQTRIDHNHWDMTTYTGNFGKFAVYGGSVYGVADHNIYDPNATLGWNHMVNGNHNDSGDLNWASATGFGTANFFYFEDNVINGVLNTFFSPPVSQATLTDCHTGGRYVTRFNTLNAASPAQTHPTGHAGHDRGCRAHENYMNTVNSGVFDPAVDQPNFAFDYNNSGGALVWGNTINPAFKNIIYMNECRSNQGCGYSQQVPPNGWGYCGNSFSGTGSAWDGNQDPVSGYPCLDQPARGQGDLLSGDFPNEINVPLGGIAYPRQALDPEYEWLNTGDIVQGWSGNWFSNGNPATFQPNRDVFLYHLNTSCNQGAGSCTAGVGSGTRAQRPASCTTGVGWWSTDQGGHWWTTNGSLNNGTLDICTSTNTWSNNVYTPFTYPHPLVGGGGPPPPPAPSITNLNPTSGLVGAQFTITGNNFGSSQGSSTATLSAQSLTVNSWSNNSIVVTVPPNAQTGSVVVTVGGQASNAQTFTVNAQVINPPSVPTGIQIIK